MKCYDHPCFYPLSTSDHHTGADLPGVPYPYPIHICILQAIKDWIQKWRGSGGKNARSWQRIDCACFESHKYPTLYHFYNAGDRKQRLQFALVVKTNLAITELLFNQQLHCVINKKHIALGWLMPTHTRVYMDLAGL